VSAVLLRKFSNKYTSVECKNWTKKVEREKLVIFVDKVNQNNQAKDRIHSIDKKIFVSTKGFVDNAIQFAEEHEIDCYIKQENKFQKVEY